MKAIRRLVRNCFGKRPSQGNGRVTRHSIIICQRPSLAYFVGLSIVGSLIGILLYRRLLVKEWDLIDWKRFRPFLENDTLVNFTYIPKWSNGSIKGRQMSVPQRILDYLHMPPRQFVDLIHGPIPKVVFVTGASANHFFESYDAIASLQNQLPQYKIVYYDLGLTPVQIGQLKIFCNVLYRKVDFSLFPFYVNYLTQYRFKPILIQMALSEFQAIFWFDTSMRIVNGTYFRDVLGFARHTGIVLFEHTHRSTFSVTMPEMFEFLPTNMSLVQQREQMGAGMVLYYNTETIYERVVKWYVLCALEPRCMSPPGSYLHCNSNQGFSLFAGCHRYDQSAMSILVLNLFEFDLQRYTAAAPDKQFLVVNRSVTFHHRLQSCRAGKNISLSGALFRGSPKL